MKQLLLLTVAAGLILLSACTVPTAPLLPGEAPEAALAPTIYDKKPEDVVPLDVLGFEFINKEKRSGLLAGGHSRNRVEYNCIYYFKPMADLRFDGKVNRLIINISLAKDVKSCTEMMTGWTGYPDNPEHYQVLQVHNKDAVLLEGEFTGTSGQVYEVDLYQQQGKLLFRVYASSTSSRHLFGPYPNTWDKQVVKDAAIVALEAARL